jgi:hypothetical protein
MSRSRCSIQKFQLDPIQKYPRHHVGHYASKKTLDELRSEAIAKLERRGYDVSGKTCGGPFLCPQFFGFQTR